MGHLGAFWGNSDGANHPRCIITRDASLKKIFGKKMTRPEETLKRSKLKTISHAFRRPRDPCTECRKMFRGDIGWYIKDSHDFERA